MHRLLRLLTILFATGCIAQAVPVSIGTLSANCPLGGTRVTTGTYDATSGAVDFQIGLTSCIDKLGYTRNGAVAITGTALTAPNDAGTINFTNLTYVFNVTKTGEASVACPVGQLCPALAFVTTSQSSCTWVKNGSFNTLYATFTGSTTKSNCTITDTQMPGATNSNNVLEFALQKSEVDEGD